jgi:hypothetical protein
MHESESRPYTIVTRILALLPPVSVLCLPVLVPSSIPQWAHILPKISEQALSGQGSSPGARTRLSVTLPHGL